MKNFDWKSEILSWTHGKRQAKKFSDDLFAFFTSAFNYNLRPDQALFGINDYSISLLVGNIYFAALTKSGSIYLLIDRTINTIPGTEIYLTKSTKTFDEPLYWFEATDLNLLKAINADIAIWQSYKRASGKIFENKSITAYKNNSASGKILLNAFWSSSSNADTLLTAEDLKNDFEKQLQLDKTISRKERLKRLKTSGKKAERVLVTQYSFKRNPLVVLEVLDRANGICGKCKRPSPFIRDSDSTPYLEVHHIIPLAENGDDTIENAIALCANCHRHAHFGKNTY